MKKPDTFSTHSLKLLEENIEEFKKQFIEGTHFMQNPPQAKEGKKFHALISYYLKGYDISKFESVLNDGEKAMWQALKADCVLDFSKNKFVAVEHPFLVKEEKFFLNGRFDAIFKGENGYTILDWKMKNLPKNPEDDLQSVVYLYCASKIFNTENISMTYCSISTLEKTTVNFASKDAYYERIFSLVSKL